RVPHDAPGTGAARPAARAYRRAGPRRSEATALDGAALAYVLRQVHNLTGESYGYVGEHRPMDPQRDWPSAFHLMWNRLLDDVQRCGGYRPDEATSLRRRLDRHLRCFDRPVRASLVHMDVWAQNLLVGAGGVLTGLLDWDRALWSDPEIEFAVLDYCGTSA